jgi:O-antigen/teichoic acid export membrane protein
LPPPDQVPATWRGTLSILRFSVSVSITGGIWIVLTQADKLLLSKILPLADYGYVTLAVAVANGVNIVSTPLGQALMPRLARLTAAGDEVGVIQLYRRSTHMIALLVSTVGAILAFSAGSILHGWTGNPQAAAQAASPLIWYALGNVSLGFAAFPYYLQFARGQLRLHIIGNLLLVSAMLPAVWWAAHEYGGSGGGMAWCITITLYLLIWVSHSHRQLLPGMALQWLVGDVLKIAIPIFATAWLVSHLAQPWIDGTRIHAIIVVALCSAGTLAAAAVMHKIVKT